MRRPAMAWRRLLQCLWVAVLLAGCASTRGPSMAESGAHWQGRLALKVYSTPVQALSANFELQGAPDQGELTLSSALGTTLARLRWDAASATLAANGQMQRFASLQQLAHHLTGTDLPVASLFAWLRGQAQPAEGWEADLSDIDNGRLQARRIDAVPAELKIILER